MSKFKVGDRVRDISPNGPGLGHSAGTIVGREHDTWVIDWDATPHGRINWHDDQIELLPSTGPVRTVTRREVVGGVYGDVGVSVHPDGEIQIEMRMLTKDAKRVLSAAMILSQIAEALDDKEVTK